MQPYYKILSYQFLILFTSLFTLNAQSTNTTLLGQLTYEVEGSDIWGYVAGGREYALMTVQTGVSIVDVTDPTQPTEVQFVEGPFTDWRDVKTWGHYAYVTNEAAEGLQIIDLSQLPDAVSATNWQFGIWENQGITLETAHNLFIDEKGIAYILGYNNIFGALMLDVNADPLNPPIVGIYGKQSGHYVHDAYVRNDTLWTAEVYNGYFAVIDIKDKANPVILATQTTPNDFTHNVWLSNDGRTLFTSDEKSGAFIAAYDVSDLSDIKELDRYQSNPGSRVIPHNAFVYDPLPSHNFLLASYYRDGLKIIDATHPHNLIEIGSYDTSPLSGGNFNGAWGVYPYLPSGNILVSDIEGGLFVIGADYSPACYLEGLVQDATTGELLSGVTITLPLNQGQENSQSDFSGRFALGTADAGTYQIQLFKYGYEEKTINVDLTNGTLNEIIVDLMPLPSFNLDINVRNRTTEEPLAAALLIVEHRDGTFELSTDKEGKANLPLFYEDDYIIQVGQWGFRTQSLNKTLSEATTLDLALTAQYYDDFAFDVGWSVSGTANDGIWERGIPTGSSFLGMQITPPTDFPNDIGQHCYVTGNGFTLADNVDKTTILHSPLFDMTPADSLSIHYQRWFFTQEGSDDVFTTRLTNGIDTILLATVTSADLEMNQWKAETVGIHQNNLAFTDQMQLLFTISDFTEMGNHLTELAIDVVRINTFVDAPIASFSAINEPAACAPFTLTLVNESEGKETNIDWNVDGGVIVEQSQDSITITYDEAGSYSPSLIVSNSGGTDTLTLTDYITVYAHPIAQIQMDLESTSICADEPFVLYTPHEEQVTYEWQLPNQESIAADSLTLQLLESSTYQLIATNEHGCISQDSITITVHPLPFFNVEWSDLSVCAVQGDTIEMNITAATEAYTYDWQAANITVSNDGLTAHFVPTNDANNYALTVTDANGCQVTMEEEIAVEEVGILDFSIENTTICAGDELVVTNLSHPDANYTWQLMHNETNEPLFSEAFTPSFSLTEVGSYTLSIDSDQCYDKNNAPSQTITVNPLPQIQLNSNLDTVCVGGIVQLMVTAEDATLQISWPPTDVVESIPNGINISSTTAGLKTYTVHALNAMNCSITDSINIWFEDCVTSTQDFPNAAFFSLYPNPNNGQFWLELSSAPLSKPDVRIFNTLGQLVKTTIQQHSRQLYQLDDLPSGLYYVVVKTEQKQFTQEILVD